MGRGRCPVCVGVCVCVGWGGRGVGRGCIVPSSASVVLREPSSPPSPPTLSVCPPPCLLLHPFCPCNVPTLWPSPSSLPPPLFAVHPSVGGPVVPLPSLPDLPLQPVRTPAAQWVLPWHRRACVRCAGLFLRRLPHPCTQRRRPITRTIPYCCNMLGCHPRTHTHHKEIQPEGASNCQGLPSGRSGTGGCPAHYPTTDTSRDPGRQMGTPLAASAPLLPPPTHTNTTT